MPYSISVHVYFPFYAFIDAYMLYGVSAGGLFLTIFTDFGVWAWPGGSALECIYIYLYMYMYILVCCLYIGV